MSLSTNIVRGSREPEWSGITKEDITDEVIAFSVNSFDPDVMSKYGSTCEAIVDLVIVTGDKAGQRDPKWKVRASLAKKMQKLSRNGSTVVAKVQTAEFDTEGETRSYLVLDEPTDDDVAQAQKVLAEVITEQDNTSSRSGPADPFARPATDEPPF